MYWPRVIVSLLLTCLITGCTGNLQPNKKNRTLGDIDISGEKQEIKSSLSGKRTKEDILNAYRQYVKNAPSSELSRQQALTRLAELELDLINEQSQSTNTQDLDANEDQALASTISLLETTLREYPEAKGNDKVLYQLSQAYDRTGQYEKSVKTMEELAESHQKSAHYAEAQFRIGEAYFARGDYISAEDAYTEVIFALDNQLFYEKSLFKRGWTRYKQQLYPEAVDDFYDAIKNHGFADYEKLSDAEKNQFNEYFRAIGLGFSYQSQDGALRDYFASKDSPLFVYETYSTVSDIYLKQERYSDAAKILAQFTKYHGKSKDTPLADIKVIEAWKAGGFTNQLYQAIETFFQRYNPSNNFWDDTLGDTLSTNDVETVSAKVNQEMRKYIVQISSYFHSLYSSNSKAQDLASATQWYQRYLKHFSSYARQDRIYSLYGELLVSAQKPEEAIQYFAKAAYDDTLILDKKSAFATISLTNDLLLRNKDPKSKTSLSEQYISYALAYIQLYPEDQKSEAITMRASELAITEKKYEKTIEIANYLPDAASVKAQLYISDLKGRAYLELENYEDAEAVYLELVDNSKNNTSTQKEYENRLALSIYRQAEQAKAENRVIESLNHYTRISKIVRQSSLASAGLYDAIAMSMEAEQWPNAITLINQFQTYYPKHKLSNDVTKKLSAAYLNSDQKGRAAQEFERLSRFGDDIEVKRAALWTAAELYEGKDNTTAAIKSYREYANNYREPYENNIEAMYRLSKLYAKTGNSQKLYFWQNKIVSSDRKATKRNKTDRSNFIASETTLSMARTEYSKFERVKLIEPIAKTLKQKKTSLQNAVKLFGQASTFGIEEITTEATFSIGDIYGQFSKSLLTSTRPKNLSPDELDQYEILLEDQAFPFEEKAIEFYETNLARTQDGTYNEWIQKSLDRLKVLFPVRYTRKAKVDYYVD